MIKVENMKCEIYDYGCKIQHGKEIQLQISVYPKDYAEDIRGILNNNNTESIRGLIELSKQKENELFEKYKALLISEYAEVANQTKLYMLALASSNAVAIAPKHTNNQWEKKTDWRNADEVISNATYKLWFRTYENTRYVDGVETPVSWQVSWWFSTNSPINDLSNGISNKTIERQDRKKYVDKDKALAYIEGRKKAYAKYFTEEYPTIPKKYAECFMMNGILLPNYTVEGENNHDIAN